MENVRLKIKDVSFTIDNYKCVRLNIKENLDYFKKLEFINDKIKNLDNEFTKNGLKAIWLNIPISESHLIPCFVKESYVFHHTENLNELIMYKWLLSTPCNLPNYATHYLGVGALIVNDEGKILLVKEKNTLKQLKDLWKIPTGLSEQGEKIQDAVVREVKEETGLEVLFEGILCCREAYPYIFNSSDIFFVCLCRCKGDQKIDIEKGEELLAYKWFNLEEIEQIIKEKKFSIFSSRLFQSILNLIQNNIGDKVWKAGQEVKFLNSRFVFHFPKF
jgi:8-oxo-dGTP pyrophosphatase MutT (NUDIX family)